jgi:hypothetical protein
MSEKTGENKVSKMTFVDYACQLNRRALDLGLDEKEQKPIPYLGWFWRNVDPDEEKIPVALADDTWWLCVRNKWDYPEKELTKEESIEALKILLEILNQYEKFQVLCASSNSKKQ